MHFYLFRAAASSYWLTSVACSVDFSLYRNKVVGNKPIVKEEKERPRLLLSKENGVSDDGEDDGNTENQANIRKHGKYIHMYVRTYVC